MRNWKSVRAVGGGGYRGGVAGEWYAVLFVGFVVFQVAVPEAAGRGIETERGVWLGGVNVGLILGMGLILVGMGWRRCMCKAGNDWPGGRVCGGM